MSNYAIDWAISAPIKSPPKAVLIVLANRANRDHVCWPSLNRIARDSGFARSTVQSALKTLESEGYLTKSPRSRNENGGQTSSLYRLSVWGVPGKNPGHAESRTPPMPGDGDEPKERSQTKNTSPIRGEEQECEEIFALYPKQSDKKAALREIRKAIERDGHMTVLRGTRAICKRLERWSQEQIEKLLPAPRDFFESSSYRDPSYYWAA